MKISMVNGENQRTKYLSAGTEKVVEVIDFSDVEEMPNHHLEWSTDIKLEDSLHLIKKLFNEERHYQCPPKDRNEDGSLYRIVTLGRTPTPDQLRLYPQDDFWKHEDPISQVQEEDICIGLLTPHYALHFFNAPPSLKKTTNYKEAALVVDNTMLKFVRTGTLHKGITHAQLSAYSNISSTIAEVIVKTSPAFASQEGAATVMLTDHLNRLLAQYQKPIKVN